MQRDRLRWSLRIRGKQAGHEAVGVRRSTISRSETDERFPAVDPNGAYTRMGKEDLKAPAPSGDKQVLPVSQQHPIGRIGPIAGCLSTAPHPDRVSPGDPLQVDAPPGRRAALAGGDRHPRSGKAANNRCADSAPDSWHAFATHHQGCYVPPAHPLCPVVQPPRASPARVSLPHTCASRVADT